MSIEAWITLALGTIITPSVAWLIREVLSLRGKMIELETRMMATDRECDRHQKWNSELQTSLTRVDKNVVRLCQASGVQETQ